MSLTIKKKKEICISDSYTLSQTASEEDVKKILEAIHAKKSARAVVMFLQGKKSSFIQKKNQ